MAGPLARPSSTRCPTWPFANATSSVLIYISSHGGRVLSGAFAGEYLLPVDTVLASDENLAQTAISGDEFSAALKATRLRKVLVIFDCCHAGGIGQPKEGIRLHTSRPACLMPTTSGSPGAGAGPSCRPHAIPNLPTCRLLRPTACSPSICSPG